MIKIIYKQEQYEYGDVGAQPYDIDTKITVKEDASIEEVFAAVIRILKVAGYQVNQDNIERAINALFNNDYYE